MKKLSLSLAALLFASSLMFSCKKEDSLAPGISGTNDNPPIGKLTSNWGIHRVWNASVGDCTAPAVNCFDDVVVRPKVIDDLVAVAAGGSSTVQNYFSGNDWQEPFPDLSLAENQQCLNDLQSGNFYMERVVNENTQVNYFEVLENGSAAGTEPTYVFSVIAQ